MLLVVDNGSLFTPNLLDALSSRSVQFRSVSCRDMGSMDGFDSVILSGRRRGDAATNAPNAGAIRHCISEGKPLLGICYGAEILAAALGGTLRRAAGTGREIRDIRVTAPNPVSGSALRVLASHRLEIARLPGCLECIASSERCRYEMIRLRGRDIFGTQFHPEATPDGRQLIGRFLEISPAKRA